MDNSTPEMIYAQQIVKNTIGTQAKVKGFEWSDGGGLFNKVFKVNTTDGNYILKIERDKIFFATRKDQIENEVLGNELFQKARISCPNILAFDFTKNDIGARYIFTEHIINNIGDSPLLGKLDDFDEATKAEIKRQFMTAVEKMRGITRSHFGSLSQSGTLGRHETYDGYYHSTLNLLIKESEELGLFTDEELDTIKKAAEKPLVYSKKYTPTFNHGDIGLHNAIWGNINNGGDKLYIFDFGNAYFGLPYYEEHICRLHGDNVDIVEIMDLDRNLYDNFLIGNFERMFWTVTECLTSKKDSSRTHITDFVNKCSNYLDNSV